MNTSPARAPEVNSPIRSVGGGLAAGLLVAFALPPWGFWPLAFVGVIIFDLTLGSDPSRRDRIITGLAFGAAWMYVGMAWMWFLTIPGYLIAGLMFATFHSVAALATPRGPWRVIGRPAAHTLAEIVRMSFPFGGIPLATFGISQAAGPLLGLARLGGVILITWVVFQIGSALAAWVPMIIASLTRRHRVPIVAEQRYGSTAVAVMIVIFLVAAVAPEGRDISGRSLMVAGVQGGGRQGTSALEVPSREVTAAHLQATATIDPGDADIIVWPENAIDVNREPIVESDEFQAIKAEAARLGVPMLIGFTEDAPFSLHPVEDGFVNAQVVVAPSGDVIDRYEKVRRVPFGEYVPLRGFLEALGAPLDRIASDAVAGRDPAQLTLPDGTEIGVMISWEVFFGDRGHAAAANGAELLINPTNGSSYTGTILQTQQVASSKLRAVETGRWIVQVSPTGFSAFISPTGEVFQRTGVSEQAVIIQDLPLRAGTTWYQTFGDQPWSLAVIALLAATHFLARRTRRAVATPPRSAG